MCTWVRGMHTVPALEITALPWRFSPESKTPEIPVHAFSLVLIAHTLSATGLGNGGAVNITVRNVAYDQRINGTPYLGFDAAFFYSIHQ